jgi:hypothetical protein
MDATQALNLPAGVWNAKVLRGHSLSWQRKADIGFPAMMTGRL